MKLILVVLLSGFLPAKRSDSVMKAEKVLQHLPAISRGKVVSSCSAPPIINSYNLSFIMDRPAGMLQQY